MSDLQRFRDAQEKDYRNALKEIQAGHKKTHWMWYVFPQIQGLGLSSVSGYYAIRDLQEAEDYLQDPVLGPRLIEICEALLNLNTSDPHAVFGCPDDQKLCSSMTLFEQADPGNPVFGRVLDRFYDGQRDVRTLEILQAQTGR